VWEISGICGRFTKSAITTYVDEYIDLFSSYFTCLMDHNSCGRMTVFRLVVIFDLVLNPGGSVGFEQPVCSSKQSS
jgi:hypothetical protein